MKLSVTAASAMLSYLLASTAAASSLTNPPFSDADSNDMDPLSYPPIFLSVNFAPDGEYILYPLRWQRVQRSSQAGASDLIRILSSSHRFSDVRTIFSAFLRDESSYFTSFSSPEQQRETRVECVFVVDDADSPSGWRNAGPVIALETLEDVNELANGIRCVASVLLGAEEEEYESERGSEGGAGAAGELWEEDSVLDQYSEMWEDGDDEEFVIDMDDGSR